MPRKGEGTKGSTMLEISLFLYIRVAGEFLSYSAQMGSRLVGKGGPDSKSSFLLSSG